MVRRISITDKWIIGGDGNWRDLVVVGPWVKISLDIIGALFHPRKYYTFKKTTILVLAFLTGTLYPPIQNSPPWLGGLVLTFLVALLIGGVTALYRETLVQHRDRTFTNMSSTEPTVPLDQSGDPRSAITLKRHVLIGGDSGSGKSNAVWQIIAGLKKYKIPFKLSVLDPAGGVELADLENASFTIDYVDRPTDADGAILDFRDRMNQRLTLLKKLGIREFDLDHPELKNEHWHYLVIDELLLCAQQIKQGPLSPLGDILAVGRKAGFIVVACTQLGQKTTLGDFRDLFPQRVCFGTRTQEMTDAVLGTAATANGALCHEITEVGQGFLWTNKARGYFGFTTSHITDTKTIVSIDPKTHGTTNQRTALYKLYSEDGTFLYANITQNIAKTMRDRDLKSREWWSTVDPEKSQLEWFPTEREAKSAYRLCVDTERPMWNIVQGE